MNRKNSLYGVQRKPENNIIIANANNMTKNNRTADHCAKKNNEARKETLKNKKSIAFSRTAFQRITFFFHMPTNRWTDALADDI